MRQLLDTHTTRSTLLKEKAQSVKNRLGFYNVLRFLNLAVRIETGRTTFSKDVKKRDTEIVTPIELSNARAGVYFVAIVGGAFRLNLKVVVE